MSTQEDIGTLDFALVFQLSYEPSYISEIARKLQVGNFPLGYDIDTSGDDTVVLGDGSEPESADELTRRWSNINEETAVERVAGIVNIVQNQGGSPFEEVNVGYDVESDSSRGESQDVGSPHQQFSGRGLETTKEWRDYKIVENTSDAADSIGDVFENTGLDDMADRIRELVAVEPWVAESDVVTAEDKISTIEQLSRSGNDISRDAEVILQDALSRQFKFYDVVRFSDYNSPGVDFYVEDERNREWGLTVEISVRWVNPIGEPYVETKKEDALDRDSDLLIIAPRFRDSLLEKYEDASDPDWNADPLSQMVHLHRVPSSSPEIYRPFAKKPDEVEELDGTGNPIIVPDSEEARELLQRQGAVGDDYPVVERDYSVFVDLLDGVNRDYVRIPESQYRNSIREAIEPLLWEFLRPYKIEQFIVDTYWERGLTQSEVGRLVDRSGSTIGRWMREWGVIRRGTGAPELSQGVIDIWKKMYRGDDPFPEQFSGYRILAEYNRHPLWDLQDWREWYQGSSEEERKETVAKQGSFRDNLDYTLMFGPNDRLQPSYTFILNTLRDNGVEIREPDEAPRVPYSAYPSNGALEFMLNKNQNTIVDTGDEE